MIQEFDDDVITESVLLNVLDMLINNNLGYKDLSFDSWGRFQIEFGNTYSRVSNLKLIQDLTNLAISKKIKIFEIDALEYYSMGSDKISVYSLVAYFTYHCMMDEIRCVANR